MKGRNRVYVANQKLELLCNGNNDGFLDKGDSIYVLKRYRIDDKSYFDFRVIKFFETSKETNTYTCEVKYFDKMFDKNNNVKVMENQNSVEGDTVVDSTITETKETKETKTKDKPINYKVPFISMVGGASIGYLIGKKYGDSTKWTIGGLIAGLAVGIFLIRKK